MLWLLFIGQCCCCCYKNQPPSSSNLQVYIFGCTDPHICVRDIPGTHPVTFSLQDGHTSLLEASIAGHVECVKLLLAGGAQTNHQNKVGTVQRWIQSFWKGVVVVWGESSSPARWYGGAL